MEAVPTSRKRLSQNFRVSFTPLIARWLCPRKGGRSNDWDLEPDLIAAVLTGFIPRFKVLPLSVVFLIPGRGPRYNPKPCPLPLSTGSNRLNLRPTASNSLPNLPKILSF